MLGTYKDVGKVWPGHFLGCYAATQAYACISGLLQAFSVLNIRMRAMLSLVNTYCYFASAFLKNLRKIS